MMPWYEVRGASGQLGKEAEKVQCEPKYVLCKFKANLCELKGVQFQCMLYQKFGR